MLKLGRWGEQIKLLHLVPRFHSNLSRHTKKNPMTQVFGGTWGKNSKCVPCTDHHLLPLPIWVDGSKRRLWVMQKRTAWGRLHLNILFNKLTTDHGTWMSFTITTDDMQRVAGPPPTIARGGEGWGILGDCLPGQRWRPLTRIGKLWFARTSTLWYGDPDYGDDRVSVFGLWRKGRTHESGDVLTSKNKKREILRAGHATTMRVLCKLESFCFSWTNLKSWSYLISWFGYECLRTIFLFQDLNLISWFSQHFRCSQHFSRSKFPRYNGQTWMNQLHFGNTLNQQTSS